MAEEVSKRERHVTVLFDNAGITGARAPRPAAPTAAEFRKAFLDGVPEEAFPNMNAVGLYWLTFAFRCREVEGARGGPAHARVTLSIPREARLLRDRPRRPAGHSYPYMFSKFAIGRATSSLAHELLPLGVRVDGTAPGLFVTSMNTLGQVDELGRVTPPARP
ncbi:NAD(P)-binding protein [Sparassis crispa]|uniref:NAD(P)-binding protein n=1 Tax=Sparassis crispa TaxID=139825 RepID=A0A401G9E2_9APHY|nr:NAD(P)-binding protein [Sparassis crispa]GBE78782.1 NAD(P)-binding protein [Sparassis crispa]